MNTSRPILFTGGHHNSALVVALKLRSQGYPVVWVGHKFTMRGDKSLSAEYQEVTQHQIPFYEIKTGKIYRRLNPLEFIKVILGFVQAFTYLLALKPRLIFSFGGYLAVPVVIVGWLLRIPSVTHEQTVTAGWANKAISPFVQKIFLTHPQSRRNFPLNKAVVTGLPLRVGLLELNFPRPRRRLLFISCGKQGSHIINQSVFPLIPQLLSRFKVVHQTGSFSKLSDQDRARKLKNSLPRNLRPRYHHRPYFFEKDAVKYLHQASLVISRAGAHTVYELLALNKKAVVIPIPWVSHHEQELNAKLLHSRHQAIVLPEKQLTPAALLEAINRALALHPRRSKTVITDATDRILAQIKPFLH